ncbi:hypothetical protein BH10BAC2_BH10BAC2_30450 [soil metagenome]
MKRFLQYSIFSILVLLSISSRAQDTGSIQDSVIQLYGVVMTADSLRAIEAASVIVENKGRGTFTNYQGVFSIVVLKGDDIRFSCVGFKDKVINIPNDLKGNQYSVIQLMVSDTAYLPATILKPRPTRSQFERDFVNADIPADQIEIARQNNDEATRRALIAALPADGREAVNANIKKQTQKYYYQGQQQPINLLNPFAWAEFIEAWKRGDFKKKD